MNAQITLFIIAHSPYRSGEFHVTNRCSYLWCKYCLHHLSDSFVQPAYINRVKTFQVFQFSARAEFPACIQALWGLIGNFMSPAGDFRHIISFSLTPAAHQGHPHRKQTHREKQQQIAINLNNELSQSISMEKKK